MLNKEIIESIGFVGSLASIMSIVTYIINEKRKRKPKEFSISVVWIIILLTSVILILTNMLINIW